ncbi:prephenate dehydrogenase [Alkalibacterium sp. 20]|uniref:prephenate dehydrogenase n=1 Tax=Alkalibacterium sp. 20 TaxID=1798803 RepID=UPI0009002A0A|nr:prephenate dehydrogenase [Alkalibacterium sp. 20]OJF97125.1 prephenate dehydrogenase [Alkalibacterium sp. 20]
MNIAIVGLGAIGGSFAMGLTDAGYNNLYGIDIDEQTLISALNQGIIKKGVTRPETVLPDADIILLSLYPGQILPFVDQYKAFFKSGAVLTDVTGIKTTIIKELTAVLPETVDFVFAHPMRGSEKQGLEGADHTQFIGANALITPIQSNKEANIKLVEKLYKDIGFERITRVTPEKHDEQIAYVSQLMHVLSVAVVNSPQATAETPLFAGKSFQELTRIADINEDLWSELFSMNKEALLNSITSFEEQLDVFKHALLNNNEQELKDFLIHAKIQRRKWY